MNVWKWFWALNWWGTPALRDYIVGKVVITNMLTQIQRHITAISPNSSVTMNAKVRIRFILLDALKSYYRYCLNT
jgi:hypothetical protein